MNDVVGITMEFVYVAGGLFSVRVIPRMCWTGEAPRRIPQGRVQVRIPPSRPLPFVHSLSLL